MRPTKWIQSTSLFLFALGLSLFWSCNVSEPTTTTSLNLKLYDSLSKDQGLYDSVRVDILNDQDSVVIRGIFHGEYLKSRDSAKLADLPLGTNPPNPLKVVIHAYKGEKEALEVVIDIRDKIADDPIASVLTTPIPIPEEKDPDTLVVTDPDTVVVKKDPDTVVTSIDTLIPITSIHIKRNLPKLFVGGPAFPLELTHTPDSVTLVPVIQSSDEGVVQVVAGSIKAVGAGVAIVTVSAKGFPLALDTVQLQTYLDKPKIDAGTDQSAAVGQRVSFKAKVTQEFGTITLSWDFNGDNVPEDSVTTDTATATYTFNTAGEYSVVFTAKDSEGNSTTLSRRIRVGLPGALVEITIPSRHTYTNTRTATIPVAWQVDGKPQTTQLTQNLTKEGAWNLIRRAFTDSLNQTSFDTVSVFWDTTTPKITFTNLKNGDIVTTANTPVAWTVDQMTQSTQTSEALSGNEGPKTISRSFTDSAGNIGTASVQVLWDKTPPSVTIDGQANRIANTAALTLTGTASDLTSGIKSIVITGAATGNGSATYDNAANTWTKTGLTLAEGPNSLTVTTTDNAGLTKTALVQITLDSRKPGAPVWSNLIPAASRTPTLTWTWTKANNDGNARFIVRRNNIETDVGAATTYSITATTDNTLYGLEVKEVDSIAGDGPWTAVRTILYDSKAPNPGITFVASPTKTPRWNFTSDGGIGTFRWHFQGQAAGSAGTGATFFAPTNLGNGRYTLCVQELDSPEWGTLWGGTNCAAIDVDTTRPVITNLKPSTGFVTNQTSIQVTFSQDGTPRSFNCNLTGDTFTDCDTTVYDLANNSQKVSTRIWSRPKVLFVKEGALNGNGSSWDNALSLEQVLVSGKYKNKEVWVATGTYTHSIDQFTIGSGMRLYGGFSNSGQPNSLSDRNTKLNETRITSTIWISEMVGGSPVSVKDVWIEGFTFKERGEVTMVLNSSQITIRNCVFDGITTGTSAVNVQGNDIHLENLDFTNSSGLEYAPVVIYNGSGLVYIEGGSFFGNTANFGSGGVFIYDGAVSIKNVILNGNVAEGQLNQIKIWGGHLTIDGCQIDEGRNGIIGTDDLITYGQNTKI